MKQFSPLDVVRVQTRLERPDPMGLRTVLSSMLLLGSLASMAGAQEGTPPEARVEALKKSLASSKAALSQYEWIQTIALSFKGEEKVRQQYRNYYGADGALQKVPVAADAKEEKKRGIRGKVADTKKAELEGSLKSAMALLDQYSPLDPARIQAAKSAGNVSVSLPSTGGAVTITIKNYLKPGDQVIIQADAGSNTIQSVAVTTALDEKSPVSAKVGFQQLADGTVYPAKQAIDIPSQTLHVDVENSGYRKNSK